LPVCEEVVAKEAVAVEGVEPEKSVIIPGLVGQDEVDVVVSVAPGERGAAGEVKVVCCFRWRLELCG
jgi:hypothetical protein